MGKGLELAVTDTNDPSNEAKLEPKTLGRFPAVACFYRSVKQRERKYGTEENIDIPKFGFDAYLPVLHGEHTSVKDSYVISSKIVSGYEALDENGNKVEVCLYPHSYERVYGTTPALDSRIVAKGQELKYFCPWLNPTSSSSIDLYVSLLYPKPDKISPDDEFIQFKNTATEDKDVEKVYFKLVHVSSNWQPIELEAGSCQYTVLGQNIPVSEESQSERNRLPALKTEVDTLQAEVTPLENKITTDKQAIDNNKTSLKNKLDERNEKAKEQREAVDAYKRTNDTKQREKADRLFREVDKIDKEREELNKQNTNLEASIKDNEQSLKDKTKTLETKRTEVQRIESRITNEDLFGVADSTLSLAAEYIKEVNFRTYKEVDTWETITLNRSGDNKNAALIAYYKRPDKVKVTENGVETTKEVEKEFIIGQVNILAAEHYKTIPSGQPFANDANINMFFNPMPIHFVRVQIKKIKEKSDGSFDMQPSQPYAFPFGERQMVEKVNEYFRQAGISFSLARSNTTMIETSLVEFRSASGFDSRLQHKTALMVGDKGFIMNGDYLTETEISTTSPKVKLIGQLRLAFKKHLMNNVLYDKGGVGSPFYTLDAFTKCLILPDGKGLPVSQRFRDFLDAFPELCPKKKEEGFFSDKMVDDPKLIWQRADGIAEYIIENTNLIFVIDGIAGEGTAAQHTAAYAQRGGNGVVMFKSGIGTCEDTLPHELGHALGLQHTFHADYPLLPDKVWFNTSDWASKKAFDGQKDGDSEAYAATYNNIMDYASKPNDSNKNVKFQRNTFTKWQWDRMLGNIKRKSYLATISGGHTNGFSDNNPYLDGSDVEIEQFVNELNKIF